MTKNEKLNNVWDTNGMCERETRDRKQKQNVTVTVKTDLGETERLKERNRNGDDSKDSPFPFYSSYVCLSWGSLASTGRHITRTIFERESGYEDMMVLRAASTLTLSFLGEFSLNTVQSQTTNGSWIFAACRVRKCEVKYIRGVPGSLLLYVVIPIDNFLPFHSTSAWY